MLDMNIRITTNYLLINDQVTTKQTLQYFHWQNMHYIHDIFIEIISVWQP